MKEQLLHILISLQNTNSWDLAEEIAKGIYNLQDIEEHYIETIIKFLQNVEVKTTDEVKRKIIENSLNSLRKIKEEEFNERIQEKQEAEALLSY